MKVENRRWRKSGAPRFTRLILTLAILFSVAGCATIGKEIKAPGFGGILVGYIVEGDEVRSYSGKYYSHFYNMKLAVNGLSDSYEEDYDLKNDKEKRERLIAYDIDEGRIISHWVVLPLKAGTYAVTGIDETVGYLPSDNTQEKASYFIERPDSGSVTTGDLISARTPQFTVEENRITYIGSFRAVLTTKPWEASELLLIDIQITDVEKRYSVDTGIAKDSISRYLPLRGIPIEGEDIFKGKPEALELYETRWKNRPRVVRIAPAEQAALTAAQAR